MAATRKARRTKKIATDRFAIQTLSFWGHTFYRLFIALIVVAGGWMIMAMTRNHAVRLPDFHVSPSSLSFVSKPEWVKGPIEAQLRKVPQAGTKISLLDSEATEKVAAILSGNPWVSEVKSVVRDFPDRIRARVELREPAAYIVRNSKYYIVDSRGVRLPGEYNNPAQTDLDLLLVVYVRSTPPPAGLVWDDPAVVEGAKTAAFLSRYASIVKGARITAIDTSNIGGRRTPRESEITLVTAEQTRIYWGKSIETSGATELAAKTKIENLKAVLDQEGNLSAKEYVDLRFPNPVFRERSYSMGVP